MPTSVTGFVEALYHMNLTAVSDMHFPLRKCDVVNRGLSGYNSRWSRILLPQILPMDLLRDTVIATVLFGANDASLKEVSPDKYISVEEYAANLKVCMSLVRTSF